jgi:hypothetical protein
VMIGTAKMVRLGLCLCIGFAAMPTVSAEALRLPLTVKTGFYERKDAAVVTTEVSFGKASIDINSIKLLKIADGKSKEVPFYFMAGKHPIGQLSFLLPEKVEAMATLTYELRFNRGKWAESAVGSEEVAAAIKKGGDLIPNPSFEELVPGKKRTNWKGDEMPKDWSLYDFFYAYRNEKDILATVRPVKDDDAADGEVVLKYVTDQREKTILRGYAQSAIFPLKPATKYTFAYRVKVVEKGERGGPWKVASASVHYLGEDKKRVHPKNYAVNRHQLGFASSRMQKKDYLNKWQSMSSSKVTPEETRFGEIRIDTDIQGIVLFDDFMLIEQTKGDAVEVKAGKLQAVK